MSSEDIFNSRNLAQCATLLGNCFKCGELVKSNDGFKIGKSSGCLVAHPHCVTLNCDECGRDIELPQHAMVLKNTDQKSEEFGEITVVCRHISHKSKYSCMLCSEQYPTYYIQHQCGKIYCANHCV